MPAVIKCPPGMKWCPSCKTAKTYEDFPIARSTRDGRYGHCRNCHNEKAKKQYLDPDMRKRKKAANKRWVMENPEQNRRVQSNTHLQAKYGITLVQKEEMLAWQGGCALCGGSEPLSRTGWHTDHDHATGRVRGILCQPCNHFVGYVERGWVFPAVDHLKSYLEAPDAVVN